MEEGDHLTLLNVYRAFHANDKNARWCHENLLNYKGLLRAVEIHNQLLHYLRRFNLKPVSCGSDADAIRKCIVTGFFANAAKLDYTGVYRTVKDSHELLIHPTSVLYNSETLPPWVVFSEVVHTTKEFMRDITAIEPQWLYELAPHYYQHGTPRQLAAKRTKLS